MKTKSKFNLDELQKEFDKIINSFTDEFLLNWFELDEEKQFNSLLNGKTIILSSKETNVSVTGGILDFIENSKNLPLAA